MVEVLETQIDFILRQADEAVPAVKASREAGVSDTTFCKWRLRHGANRRPTAQAVAYGATRHQTVFSKSL